MQQSPEEQAHVEDTDGIIVVSKIVDRRKIKEIFIDYGFSY